MQTIVVGSYDKMSYIDIMSPISYKTVRLNRAEARKLVSKIMIVTPFNVDFTGHALERMSQQGMIATDVINVLKSLDSKIHIEGELHKSHSYTYRLETRNMVVVVGFYPDGSGLSVVTTWDKRRK